MEMFQVPRVQRTPWALIAFTFNLFLPGVGTMMAGARTGVQDHWNLGFLQFALFALGVGLTLAVSMLALIALAAFGWSIVWGILILVRSE